MDKVSLTSALVLALTVAASAGAQTTDRPEGRRAPNGAQQDSGFRRGPRGPRGPEGILLRGITLSADQQRKLADLREQDRKQWEANRPRREDGQKGATAQGDARRAPRDSAAVATRRTEMERRFEQRIAAVRQILTAEQRVQFDKNVADAKARRQQDGGRFGGPRPRDGFGGQRGR